MSKRPKSWGKLVGRRIPTGTPVGDSLAKLRVQYAMASAVTAPDEDLRRRMMETSLNVDAPLDLMAAQKARVQRARLIRERIQRLMDTSMKVHGRYPDTIGIPAETIDEVRSACCEMEVMFVVSEA